MNLKNNLLIFVVSLNSLFIYSQDTIPLEINIKDTNEYNGRKIIVFTDNSWEYIEDFVVVEKVKASTKGKYLIFTQEESMKNWKTTRTVLNRMNCSMAKDTVFLNIEGNKPPVKATMNSGFKIRWGRWHQGNDFACPIGTKVFAALDGKVRYAQYNTGGFGNLIIIRHNNGLETYYAHLLNFNVQVNDSIKSGQHIGNVGTTGHSSGPHLHFEVRFFDCPLDPQLFINKKELLICSNIFKSNSKKGEYFDFKTKFNIEYNKEENNYTIKRRKRNTVTIINEN